MGTGGTPGQVIPDLRNHPLPRPPAWWQLRARQQLFCSSITTLVPVTSLKCPECFLSSQQDVF